MTERGQSLDVGDWGGKDILSGVEPAGNIICDFHLVLELVAANNLSNVVRDIEELVCLEKIT